jgi:hypothetical protein
VKREVEAYLKLSDGGTIEQTRAPSGRVAYRFAGRRAGSGLLEGALRRLQGRLSRTQDSARRTWLNAAARAARSGADR